MEKHLKKHILSNHKEEKMPQKLNNLTVSIHDKNNSKKSNTCSITPKVNTSPVKKEKVSNRLVIAGFNGA